MTQNQNKKESRRWLKHGMLAAPVRVVMTHPPEPNARFPEKMNLAFILDGQDFGVSLSTKNPQWDDLVEAFGDPGPAWVGKAIRLSDGASLKVVNVEPAT